jgi:hypothetical protein
VGRGESSLVGVGTGVARGDVGAVGSAVGVGDGSGGGVAVAPAVGVLVASADVTDVGVLEAAPSGAAAGWQATNSRPIKAIIDRNR